MCSARPHYATEHAGMVRYELDTGTRYVRNFGTNSIPAPGHFADFGIIGYRYPTLWYHLDTGTLHIGKFGTLTQVYPGYRNTLDHNTTGGTGICSAPGSIPYRTLRYGLVRTRYWYLALW